MIAFFIGVFSFVLAGLGLGGGALLIPCLTGFLHMAQSDAQYVGLIAYLPAALGAMIYGLKNKMIRAKETAVLVPAGLLGAAAGALFSRNAENALLKKIYGVFLIFFGIYMIFSAVSKRKKESLMKKANRK